MHRADPANWKQFETKGKRRAWLAISCLVGLVVGVSAGGLTWAGESRSAAWEQRFAIPPPDARILQIIHNWPDSFAAQDSMISRLTQKGFGGVVCNVSFDQYLESETKWIAFTRAVNAAKRAGFALWLYDERGYPSGNAGGLTLRGHPEWEARGLLIGLADSQEGLVTLDMPPGRMVLVRGFPVSAGAIDLSQGLDLAAKVHAKKLEWQAPVGQWRVVAITEDHLYEGTHADGNLHAKIPYINLLMAEPTARFLELTYGSYAKHLGNDLSKAFVASFTDEPSLMSLFLKPMPHRPLPWAENLPREFRKRRGYALDASNLPALVTDAGPATYRIRYDFWQTVGELVSQNFFGQVQTCNRQHHIPSGGHLLLEENLVGHVPLYGDFFRCIRRLDAPSIDCLTSVPSEVPWFSARLLSSAAELEGRTLIMCETSDHSQRYRPPGDTRPRRTVTEEEIRGTCNRLMVAGINSITSYYSFADLTDEQLRRINEWVGRCCSALRGGYQVADVAVIYPAESLWTRFIPSRHWTKDASAAARIENVYHSAAEGLFNSHRDFTLVDSRALTESKAKAGFLVHGRLRWRVLILPGTDTLPMAAWENLARFVRQGGVVVALGALPANSEREFPSARVRALAREVFGGDNADNTAAQEPRSCSNANGGVGIFLPHGLEALLPQVLDNLLQSDLRVSERGAPLRVTHRRIEDHDVYFVVNDGARPWAGPVEFAAFGSGERWNPATGCLEEKLAAPSALVKLEPYGAACFRFARASAPPRHAIGADTLPGLSLHRVPGTEPTVGHGEFVRGELTPKGAGDSRAWQAAAVLTKAQVDTHLFVHFRYPQPLDLSGSDCLAFETLVPAGQATPTQLLVILQEQGGGDFIAETGRSLAVSGQERTMVALGRFRLAGWSQDNDGVLDLSRVSDIRIGWGGYLGAEGEQVQFSVTLPQTGVVLQRHQ